MRDLESRRVKLKITRAILDLEEAASYADAATFFVNHDIDYFENLQKAIEKIKSTREDLEQTG
jgi:hypothetical protein